MSKNNTIKEMYREDRPYEKCERFGAENLTDAELLAVILRTGTKGENSLELARRLLHPDLTGKGILNIHQWTLDRLLKIRGIGKVKAVQILCLSELSKRMAKSAAIEGLDFSSPKKIAQYYMEPWIWLWYRPGNFSLRRCRRVRCQSYFFIIIRAVIRLRARVMC